MPAIDPLAAATALALLALVGTAAWSDLRTRRISNRLTATGLAAALLLRALAGPDALLGGLAAATIGFGVGFLLFAPGWLGGGDAKLLAAVGAFLEPRTLLVALLATALAGGALALVEAVRHRVVLLVMLEAGTVLKRTLLLPLALLRPAPLPTRPAAAPAPGPHLRAPDRPGTLTIPYGVAIGVGAIIGFFFPGVFP